MEILDVDSYAISNDIYEKDEENDLMCFFSYIMKRLGICLLWPTPFFTTSIPSYRRRKLGRRKHFKVWGLDASRAPSLLGERAFSRNRKGTSLFITKS